MIENTPQSRLSIQMYNYLGEDYQVYVVLRKPGLAPGTTLQDMANDYAAMIREEFGGPINVIGLSTGGGHPASGKQFRQDVLEFLREDRGNMVKL